MSKKIIGLLNSYTTGTSGGDVRFVEILKHLPAQRKVVVTSRLGREFCLNRGLEASFYETSSERKFKFGNILIVYFMRILRIFSIRRIVLRRDILYSGSDILPDVIPAFFCKLFQKDVVWIQMIFHLIPSPRIRAGSPSFNNILSYIGQRLALLLIKNKADKVIVINTTVRDNLEKMGIPINKIYLGRMGVNKDFFDSIEPNMRTGFEGVFIGRIHPTKGILDLVYIWKEVCKVYPDAKLAIIGDGSVKVKKELFQQIKKCYLEDNIALLGHLDDIKAYSILKSSKVFLLPSYEEGWGLVIAEAMACGIPVFVYDLPVYREIFPKGLLKIPIRDKNVFAQNVIKFLKNEQLRRQLSQLAFENLSFYNWSFAGEKEWGVINGDKR